jgi:HTH-type transcriptional regulator/antitoxin HigA
MTIIFNNKTYGQLLADIAPQVIETEAEYERLLKIAEYLTLKKNLTPEERALDKLLVRLIEDYEEEKLSNG